MEINLSWDLFVIVFFAVIIAYSFIVGRNKTLKIIISSYIAILASDGIGNIIEHYFLSEDAIVDFLTTSNENAMVIMKILIFVFTIVIITTRGRFEINVGQLRSMFMKLSLTLTYGILSAGLIVSTVLIYASGTSLVQESLLMNDTMIGIYKNSQLVRLMINNYNVWFSLPAITFVVSSFIGHDE